MQARAFDTHCGPFGFPMTDDQAFAVQSLAKKAVGPFRRIHCITKSVETDSRTDISWISTETPDRYNEVVLAQGMDNSAYQLNPIVTLNHDYSQAPIGRSNWQRYAKSRTGVAGIQAQTYYPEAPAGYAGTWPPDQVFAQICAGLLNGKSIGFIPLKISQPEAPGDPLTINQWALIEYAVGTIPVNPDTTVISITKTAVSDTPQPTRPDLAVSCIQFLESIDAEKFVQNILDKLHGRV